MVIENVGCQGRYMVSVPFTQSGYGLSPSIGVSVCTVFTWAGRCYGTIGRSRPLTGHSHGSSSESLSNSWLEARKEHLMQ